MSLWKPEGYPSLAPYVLSASPKEEIDFITHVFGGEVVFHKDRPDGSLAHAEVMVDDSVLMIASPQEGASAQSATVHLYCIDAEATFRKAVAHGAHILQEPLRRKDDDLRCAVISPGGITWWFSTL